MGKVTLPFHTVKVYNNVQIDMWDAETGEVIDHRETHNTTLTAGLNTLRDAVYWMTTADGTQPRGIYYMSVGESTVARGSTSTGLGSEIYRDTPTQRTKSDAAITYKLFLSASQANGSTLTEIGMHANTTSTSASAGELYAAALYTAVVKSSAVGVTFSWQVSWADDGA